MAQPRWRDFVLSKGAGRAGCCHLGGRDDETRGDPWKKASRIPTSPNFHPTAAERGKPAGVRGCPPRPPLLPTRGQRALLGERSPVRAALWENEPVPLCPRQPTAGPVTGRCGHPQLGVTLSAVHRAPAEPGGASSLTCAGPGTSFLSQRCLRSHLPCGDISGAASAQGSCRDIAAPLAPAFSVLFQPRLGGKIKLTIK